jgi:hypothetical protein
MSRATSAAPLVDGLGYQSAQEMSSRTGTLLQARATRGPVPAQASRTVNGSIRSDLSDYLGLSLIGRVLALAQGSTA